MAKLLFNSNHEIDIPELVLGTRNYGRLGSITGITDLSYEYYLMQPNTIHFQVHKMDNCHLWEDIRDGRFVWLKDYNEWYQIQVKVDETNETVKTVTGTSLCECELAQVILVDTEINTEDDIGRDSYTPTIFYNPDNESASLLHRLLKKAPHYQIGHVDQTLCGLQRTFSISETSLYDELMGEIAEEFECLFLFDSSTRTIHAYDLLSSCPGCGYRGEYTDSCPHCGSTDISEGYGTDTAILVDTENLSESISLEGRMDELKNYFRVCGGDAIMDSYVAACNPSGTNYIYALSNFDREDMSAELSARLDAYQKETAAAEGEYKELVRALYKNIQQQLDLKSAMMPDIAHAETNAENELNKLIKNENTNSSSSVQANRKFFQTSVAVANEKILNNLTTATASSAVLGMAKCLVNSTVYRVTITAERLENRSDGKYWIGKFKLVNQSDSTDCAENANEVECKITADYVQYVKDRIQKTIDRSDVYLVDLFDHNTEPKDFEKALQSYCLERLLSFENAYQSVLDVLTENKMSDQDHETYETLYKNYFRKLQAIQAETRTRQSALYAKEEEYRILEESKNQKNQRFNLRTYLGEELYKEFCSYRREDVYKNDNYISDGLTDTEIFKKAEELLETAKKEAQTASVLHYTLSSTLHNLLALKEFQPLTEDFEGGNWIRIQVDNRLFKLRLIHYTIDFQNIQNLAVEFSDVTETPSGLTDVNSLMKQVQSMSTNFSYIARQSSQGEKAEQKISQILENGLNASLSRIKNSDKQEIVIDSHGILGRRYDDITDTYSAEQFKLIHNTLVFTSDHWESAGTALGKITYTDPQSGEQINDYGLIAQAVISGKVISNDIIGGNIYSDNYKPAKTERMFEKGSHINLEAGTFSFGDGSLRCEKNGDQYKLSFHGAVNITNTEDVRNTIGVTSLESGVDRLQSQINQSAGQIELLVGDLVERDTNTVSVSSRLSMEKGDITIESNRLTIKSDNFKLEKNGEVEAKGSIVSSGISKQGMPLKTEVTAGAINFYNRFGFSGTICAGDYKDDGIYIGVESYPEHEKDLSIGVINETGTYLNYYVLNTGQNADARSETHVFFGSVYSNSYITANEFKLGNAISIKVKEDTPEKTESISITGAHDTQISGNLYVSGDFSIGGEKNRVVDTEHYGTVKMNAFETTGAYFSDIGSGEIHDGTCTVSFDPIFAETIETDCPYQVFLTNTSREKTDFIEKHPGYFIVHGENGASFDWMITAKQKGYKNTRMEPYTKP